MYNYNVTIIILPVYLKKWAEENLYLTSSTANKNLIESELKHVVCVIVNGKSHNKF